MKRNKAFTLVELLVVISIIAVLLAILMPSLQKARAAARWAICGGNLRQWGIAMQGYTTENNGKPLATVKNNSAIAGPVAAICAMNKSTYNAINGITTPASVLPIVDGSAMFSVDSIKSYLPNFDYRKLDFGGVWRCPENQLNMNAVVKWHIEQTINRPYPQFPFFVTCYSYFGRMDYYLANGATISPQLRYLDNTGGLTGKTFSSRFILMNDTIFQQNTGGWSYNHGKGGSSCHINDASFKSIAGSVRRVEDINYKAGKLNVDATGANQLYGDGSVVRKTIRDNSVLNYLKFDALAASGTATSQNQMACVGAGGDKSYYFPRR